MNSDYSIIPIIVIVVMILVIGTITVYQNKRRAEMLTHQAEKRNGEVTKGGLLSRRELRLPYKGNTITIYSVSGSRYSPPKTVAIMKLEGLRLSHIEIVRNGLGQKLLVAFGKERILTNDEEFDRQCVVRGDDPSAIQRMLSADLKQKLIDRSLRSLEVKVSPQEVHVTILDIPSNDDAYDDFIDTALAVLQKIL